MQSLDVCCAGIEYTLRKLVSEYVKQGRTSDEIKEELFIGLKNTPKSDWKLRLVYIELLKEFGATAENINDADGCPIFNSLYRLNK